MRERETQIGAGILEYRLGMAMRYGLFGDMNVH